ncbi:hypothetical protein [Pyrococcus kukulkanii]|uniref:Uncharacterized protein n=1 Tax=Pyrococcus kukulkanii TaxID=1609559 RepID=A0ABV4T5H0_9EURY
MANLAEYLSYIFDVPVEKVWEIINDIDNYMDKATKPGMTLAGLRRELDRYVKEKYKGRDYYLALAVTVGLFVDRVIIAKGSIKGGLCDYIIGVTVGPYTTKDDSDEVFDRVTRDLLGVTFVEALEKCMLITDKVYQDSPEDPKELKKYPSDDVERYLIAIAFTIAANNNGAKKIITRAPRTAPA